MSVRLSVFNIPAGLGLKEFAEPFSRLPGFKNADLVTGPNNHTYETIDNVVLEESWNLSLTRQPRWQNVTW